MKTTRQLYLLVINLFIVATLIALCATAYLTLAKATISVPGDKERFTNAATVQIRPEGSDDGLQGLIISRDYTLSQDFPVGAVATTATKAGGIVTIVNNYNRSQSLVRTTRLQSPDGKIFRITEPVTVAAGAKVTVFAEADQEGDEYLLDATKFTIPGLWEGIQDQIYAESSSAMSYDRRGPATVTEAQVQSAVETLTDRLLTQALADFQKDYPELQDVSKEQLYAGQTTVATEPLIGQEASNVKVTITRTVAAVATDRIALEQKLREALIEKLPAPNSFIELIPDTLTYSIVSIDTDAKTAELDTELSAWVHSSTSIPNLDLRRITGKSKAAALDYLRSEGVQNAEIELFPSFSPTLPFLKSHITIEAK